MALTTSGSVYTWGSGLMGALGHGTRDDELSPRRVDRLRGGATQIVTGKFLSAALSEQGVVFAWGWDGCEMTPCDKAPAEQRALAHLGPVSRLAAGSFHLAALHGRGVATWRGEQQLRDSLLVDCGARARAERAA
jgi:alpha-tubulin suppressor-like RCC1 family protein